MNKTKLIVPIVLLFFSSIIASQNIQLVFRYDDYRLKKNTLDEQIIHLFKKYHIPLSLGIIPCDEKEKLVLGQFYPFLPELKRDVAQGSVEVALHGLTYVKLGNGEFGNVPKEEQYRRIKKGISLLESIFKQKVVTFIPPWNSYDANTLDVLESLKLKGISSSLCVGQAFTNGKISYFPNTIDTIDKLPEIIRANKSRLGIIVVMFHHYDFNQQFTLQKLECYLAAISKDNNLQCIRFKDLYLKNEIADKTRMEANLKSNLLYKYLHLKGMIQTTFYATGVRLINMFLYIVANVFFYLLSYWLSNKKGSSNHRKPVIIMAVGWCIFIGLLVWFLALPPIKLFLFLMVLSLFVPYSINKFIYRK